VEPHDIVTGARWELLQQIALHPQTGAALALQNGTTPANVSQHLKLLELAGLVSRVRINGKAMQYQLAHQTALITLLTDAPVRTVVPLTDMSCAELRLLCEGSANARTIRWFILQHEDLVKTFLAFGRVHSQGPDTQLFVISNNIKPLRKEYANIHFGTQKLVIWSHTPEEVRDGLARNEPYFHELFNTLDPLYDPQHLFTTLRGDDHE
jgi:hypothetical protein